MDVDESFRSESEPALQDIKFKCNVCGFEFRDKYSFMKHRKTSHITAVPSCNNFYNGYCKRSDTECWYNHDQGSRSPQVQQKQGEKNQPQQQQPSDEQQQVFWEV